MYKKILVLAFCFGSICAEENDVQGFKPVDHKNEAEISKLTKKIEKMDIAIELKFIKSMLGFSLYVLALEYFIRIPMPNNRFGYLGVLILGCYMGSLPFYTGLISAAEGYAFIDVKKKLEAERARLESACPEQNVSALSS